MVRVWWECGGGEGGVLVAWRCGVAGVVWSMHDELVRVRLNHPVCFVRGS